MPEYRVFWNPQSQRWLANIAGYEHLQGAGADPVEALANVVELWRRQTWSD